MRKFRIPYIPYRSLLLSTTVLNDIDLGRKEFLWRSVLEYIYLSFNGWCARVAAYGVSWGIHRAGTSNRPLIILKSRVSLANFLRSSN